MPSTSDLNPAIHQLLLHPRTYPHPVSQLECVSTHISQIYLTGDFAYKFKKPLHFGFLDFSTLALRKFYCEEEIRLNRRFAPDLYLKVVAIAEQDGQLRLVDPQDNEGDTGDIGEIIEYGVLMRQFDRTQELANLLKQQQLSSTQIAELAETIAAFHQQTTPVAATANYGDAHSVIQPLRDNFTDLCAQPHSTAQSTLLGKLQHWVEQEWADKKAYAAQRKQQGYIRACHGDLHLGNIAVIDGKITPFDGIEFDPALYQIDVMSELAFPLMDLESHQQPHLAMQLLNGYLSHTGDYAGLRLLPFYKVYRALVRAKINALQAEQQEGESRQQQRQQAEHYVRLAAHYTQPRPAVIFITHGLSGSGKTWQSRTIAAQIGAIHIRSDVERKRLDAQRADSTTEATNTENSLENPVQRRAEGLYSADMTTQTYAHLAALTKTIVTAGFSVIVDATFLDYQRRALFHKLARQLPTRLLILHFDTPEAQLRQNIRQRQQQGTDASDADLNILDRQRQHYSPLQPGEQSCTLTFGQDLPLALLRQFMTASD